MNDLFKQPDPSEITIDQNKKYLEELVGEGKKFSDTEELAKGKWHSDQTIETMKLRMDELRADYQTLRSDATTKANLQELVDQLKERLASSANTPAKEDEKQPMIDPEQIKTLVTDSYRTAVQQDKEAQNFNAVQARLKEKFGSNYAEHVSKQIEDLGLTADEVNSMAKRSPKAFYKTFGLDEQPKQESFSAPPRSQQRRDTFAPTGSAKRTWAYYQELKKKDSNLYYDPKIANQMLEDQMELGEAFYDGDFYVKGLHEREF